MKVIIFAIGMSGLMILGILMMGIGVIIPAVPFQKEKASVN